MSWSPPAAFLHVALVPHFIFLLPRSDSTREECRQQQHHLDFCVRRGMWDSSCFPRPLPTGSSMCKNKWVFRAKGDASLGLLKPKKESQRWQAGDLCFSRERLGGFLMREKDTSINEHLLKNRIIYSLTRKAALSKHGWQREGIEHLRGACLQNKENI